MIADFLSVQVAFGSGAVAAAAGVASLFFPPLAIIALPVAGLAASNTVASWSVIHHLRALSHTNHPFAASMTLRLINCALERHS